MRWYEYTELRSWALRGAPLPAVLSPRMLAQELVVDPFHVLIACCLLNRTGRAEAHRALWCLIARWPDAAALAHCNQQELVAVVRTCGFAGRRSAHLIAMAREWRAGARPPGRITGCGPYAFDSHSIVVARDWRVDPEDVELQGLLWWLRSEHGCDRPARPPRCLLAPGHGGACARGEI